LSAFQFQKAPPDWQLTQYSGTNVIHFLFSLLRIKGLYMIRALLAQLQEALHKRHGILRACYVSWLHQDWIGTGVCYVSWLQQDWSGTGVCCVSWLQQDWSGTGVCYVSWLHQDWSRTRIMVQPTDITRTPYTKCRLCSAS
jgi:hypothetical protein